MKVDPSIKSDVTTTFIKTATSTKRMIWCDGGQLPVVSKKVGMVTERVSVTMPTPANTHIESSFCKKSFLWLGIIS